MTVGGVAIDPGQYSEKYQWYRTGIAIPGATLPTYTPGSPDVGKGISVAVTIASDGYLPITTLSPRTQLLGAAADRRGAHAQYHVVVQPTGVGNGITLAWTCDGIPDAAVTVPPKPVTRTYQWYRDAVAIAGATKFQLHADHR